MPIYSRWQSRLERKSQQRILLMLGGSVVLVIIIFTVGLPALFNFTGTISNLSRKPAATTKTEIGVAPTIPQFWADQQATSGAKTKVRGTTDPQTTVEVFQNARSLGTVISDTNGNFSLDVDLEKGVNTFTAVAMAETGAKSASSDNYLVTLLTGKPKLDISSPGDASSTNNTPVTISGQTDPGDTVSINDHLTVVGGDGKFNYSQNLNDGDNQIKVTASDPAGNQTVKQLTVKYQH